MKKQFSIYLLIILSIALLASCSVKRFVPDGELLLDGYEINLVEDSTAAIKDKAALKTALQNVLSPKANATFLGMRPGLYYHYKVARDSGGFIARFLNRKIGTPPVYLSDVEEQATSDLLRNRLENRGFFFSNIATSHRDDIAAKEATVTYEIVVPQPYQMESYQIDRDSIPFNDVLEDLIVESPIQKGSRFDLSAFKLERERIDRELKDKGYYNFNSNFLIFQADTNQYDNRKFDLFLKLKKEVPERAVKPYQISQVNVYPNNSLPIDSVDLDTTRYAQKNYIQENQFFLPKRLDPFVLIEKGDLYNPSISSATSRRLGSIGSYKFVNIEYKEVDTLRNDSLNFLEANIYLSPLKKRALRAQLQAVTKSNDFAGPHLALTFSNRNLFKGGEILNITADVGYEFQISSSDQVGQTSLDFGLGTDLVFPRLLFPYEIDSDIFKYSIPKTITGLEVDLVDRSQLYGLLTFSGNFGYSWQANKYVTHEIDPISINYVNLLYQSDEFDQILNENQFLRNSFEQEFISGLTYSFTYNGLLRSKKEALFFINSTVDIAGNSVSLLAQENDEGKGEFLGLEYAQYAKADVDFRFHYLTGKEQRIATRFFAGLGTPYGNSEVMPFSKQYFSGGAYSIRAFRTRSLGPGTYTPPSDDDRTFFDQSGNLKLEANVEYRFPLFSYLKGAVFADAGNVWNTSDDGLAGGKFTSNFINELGIGAGVGVRVDIQGFVLRFDLAAPLHDPSQAPGERWVNDFDSPVFNFAIGYPF